MAMKLRKLSYAMGTEVTGVDLSRPLDDATFRQIYQALLEHCVLLFRGAAITRAQYVAFGKRFGKLRDDQIGNLPDYPEIKALIAPARRPAAGQLQRLGLACRHVLQAHAHHHHHAQGHATARGGRRHPIRQSLPRL